MSNPMDNLMSMMKPQKPQINTNQFKQFIPQLTKEQLANFVTQARGQGISEADIEAGLNFILSLK